MNADGPTAESPRESADELVQAAVDYLLGDDRGEDVEFERRLSVDPAACELLADLVLLRESLAPTSGMVAGEGPLPAVDDSPATRIVGRSGVVPSSSVPRSEAHLSPHRWGNLQNHWQVLAGVFAVALLLGLWVGFEWGQAWEEWADSTMSMPRQKESGATVRGTSDPVQIALPGSPWSAELLRIWSHLPAAEIDSFGDANFAEHSTDLEPVHDRESFLDSGVETTVPEWMWSAVSPPRGEPASVQPGIEEEFELEETL